MDRSKVVSPPCQKTTPARDCGLMNPVWHEQYHILDLVWLYNSGVRVPWRIVSPKKVLLPKGYNIYKSDTFLMTPLGPSSVLTDYIQSIHIERCNVFFIQNMARLVSFYCETEPFLHKQQYSVCRDTWCSANCCYPQIHSYLVTTVWLQCHLVSKSTGIQQGSESGFVCILIRIACTGVWCNNTNWQPHLSASKSLFLIYKEWK